MSTYLWWLAFSASVAACALATLAVAAAVHAHGRSRRAWLVALAVLLACVGFSGIGATLGHGLTACMATKADPSRSCF